MEETYNITQAKAHLSRIIANIEKTGKPVTITRAGKPLIVLKPFRAQNGPREIGLYDSAKLQLAEDWAVWDDDEAKALGIVETD